MSDWMKKLQKMEGAVDKEYDPFDYDAGNVLRSTSPSMNWILGKGSGVPFGYGMVLYGPPKSGKSLISNLFAGALHAQDPEAIAIKFNTEMRESGQMSPYWGIDENRYQAYDVNEPELIFDRITNEIFPMVQQGMPLKLIIIDSLQQIQGVKQSNRESMTNHLMGDKAKTIQDGLEAILPVIRRHRIALICTAQIRGNMDAGMYGPKEKMAGGWAQKHFFEYFVEVKKDSSSASKIEDDSVKDFRNKKALLGHKIYIKNVDSSVGRGTGRSGQFTLTYDKGLTNVGEEIATLAKNLGLVEMPNNRTYIVKDLEGNEKKYSSKADFNRALEEDQELAQSLLEQIYAKDK